MKAPRVPLYGFPDVILHAQESEVKSHSEYIAVKGGDLRAADVLTSQLVSSPAIEQIGMALEGCFAERVPIHALESAGVNLIPAALATELSRVLIQALRAKHGPELEEWWQQSFGFGFECLTRSEARYLENTANAHIIRDRLIAAGSANGP